MAKVKPLPDNAVRDKIFDQIDLEREYQDRKWWGPEHNDIINFNNWVAALAVATVESVDRELEKKY